MKLKKILKRNITITAIMVTLVILFFIFTTLVKSTEQKEVLSYRTFTKAYWINETHMMDFVITVENNNIINIEPIGVPIKIR